MYIDGQPLFLLISPRYSYDTCLKGKVLLVCQRSLYMCCIGELMYLLTLKVGATPIGPLLLNAAINNNNNNNKTTPTTSLPAFIPTLPRGWG